MEKPNMETLQHFISTVNVQSIYNMKIKQRKNLLLKHVITPTILQHVDVCF